MPVTVVVGAQWGDEGKGKVVDLLSASADIVARYQGGANAGHTVVEGGRRTVLHLIPSGIFNPKCVCLLGSGMVVDPVQLLEEINHLESMGVNVVGRLFVSHRAHLIMPYHKLLDQLEERSRGNQAIGVTGRGIGPAYLDKYNRIGIRIVDLLDRDAFVEKLSANIAAKNRIIQELHGESPLDPEEIVNFYLEFDRRIDPLVKDVSVYLDEAISRGMRILCEGAQGTLLDVDWGTYPYVTSSNPSVGGALTGLGIGPTVIDRVIGVMKAYTTRVGYGPFPTEFEPDLAQQIREVGDEYGATTGRARRCGWFDAVMARYSARVNGISAWALTKLDVLSELDEVRICVGYEYQGRTIEHFPAENRILKDCKPRYEFLPGWRTPIGEARSFDELPGEAQRYIRRIEQLSGRPIGLVSVGCERSQVIRLAGV